MKAYKDYFDIRYMIEKAKQNNICFVIAVSEDKERGAGKTYSSARFLYEEYKNTGKRFILLTRYIKTLGHVAEGIFMKYLANEEPEARIEEKQQAKGCYSEVYIVTGDKKEQAKELIGYVIPLKCAQESKLFSSMFSAMNVKYFYMDEFMPLDNRYLTVGDWDETQLIKFIYDSVNRDMETLQIILTANCISLGNPYFHMLGLNSKIQSNTHKIKTDRVIYENVVVDGLAKKHMESAVNRAFGMTDEDYISNVWIGDNNSLVCKPGDWGHSFYVCTLQYKEQKIGIHRYINAGVLYASRTVDGSSPYSYCLTLDGRPNVPLLKTSPLLIELKNDLFKGNIRCSDGGIQRILLEAFG